MPPTATTFTEGIGVGVRAAEDRLQVADPDAMTIDPADLLDAPDSTADARGRHRIELEAYGYRWFRAGGIDHADEA